MEKVCSKGDAQIAISMRDRKITVWKREKEASVGKTRVQ